MATTTIEYKQLKPVVDTTYDSYYIGCSDFYDGAPIQEYDRYTGINEFVGTKLIHIASSSGTDDVPYSVEIFKGNTSVDIFRSDRSEVVDRGVYYGYTGDPEFNFSYHVGGNLYITFNTQGNTNIRIRLVQDGSGNTYEQTLHIGLVCPITSIYQFYVPSKGEGVTEMDVRCPTDWYSINLGVVSMDMLNMGTTVRIIKGPNSDWFSLDEEAINNSILYGGEAIMVISTQSSDQTQLGYFIIRQAESGLELKVNMRK
jgi:hypothetical protein